MPRRRAGSIGARYASISLNIPTSTARSVRSSSQSISNSALHNRLAVRCWPSMPPVPWVGHADALNPVHVHATGLAVEDPGGQLTLQVGLNPQEFESRTCFAATVTGWSQAEQGHLMGVPAIDVGRGVQRLRTTLSMIVKMPPPSGSSR
jgi:hypothetical protein